MNDSRIAYFALCIMVMGFVIYVHYGNIFDKNIRKPPKQVRTSAMIEGAFTGLLIAVGVMTFITNNYLGVILFGLGLLWFFITINIYLAKKWVRPVLLILSIIRCFTIFGIIFSLPTMYLLYKPQSSSNFFNNVEADRYES